MFNYIIRPEDPKEIAMEDLGARQEFYPNEGLDHNFDFLEVDYEGAYSPYKKIQEE